MIRAAALYSKPEIPWHDEPDGTHQICVAGQPDDADYLYTLVQQWRSPEEPARFSGVFGLKPSADSTPDNVSSVTGTLAGELMIDTYGLGALVDTMADTLREFHGDLKPPWDSAPGKFNHHDRAATRSLPSQMPHLAAKFDHYFKFNNLLDEFNSPAGPIVLFNVDMEVRLDALKKYPLLYDFYRKVVPAVVAKSDILDTHGNYWMREAFDHGHIHFTIMLRNGLLTPFNAAMQPAGDSVALGEITRGSYRTLASGQMTSLAMNFGLANIGFTTDYRRDADTCTFVNRMNASSATRRAARGASGDGFGCRRFSARAGDRQWRLEFKTQLAPAPQRHLRFFRRLHGPVELLADARVARAHRRRDREGTQRQGSRRGTRIRRRTFRRVRRRLQ